MGNSLTGKMIYYWIFILGGISISYLLKLATDGMDFIILLIALTLVFWGMEFIKHRNRQRKGVEAFSAKSKSGKAPKKK